MQNPPHDGCPLPSPARTTVLVCVNCRAEGETDEGARAGRRLHDALAARAADDVRVVGVECLSVCKRPVTLGFASVDKWTYLYGDFDAGQVDEILETARLYGIAEDGLIPWKSRPTAFKKGVVARIPPFAADVSEAR